MSDDAAHTGMATREEWEASEIHKASRYSCGKCCERFETPHEVYDHMDLMHPQTTDKAKEKAL